MIATYTKTGTKATTAAKLDKAVFNVPPTNHELLKAAYTMYLANGRSNLAVTKTRGKVNGGGRKPWRQKGTGRARVGSSRSPIWRGGGITFGPTGEENYSQSLNVKARRLAVCQALSLAASGGGVKVIEDVVVKSGRTADLVKLLAKVSAERRILIVVTQKTPEFVRASRNLSLVKLVSARYVNVFDVLNADCILLTLPSLKELSDWLLAPTTKEKQ